MALIIILSSYIYKNPIITGLNNICITQLNILRQYPWILIKNFIISIIST